VIPGAEMHVVAPFPQKLQFLFDKARYKVAHGGRGGAKSWGAARALLILGTQRPLRIVCCREIQKSIDDSVHELLENQIKAMLLERFYKVQNTEIIGVNGTRFTFHGLKHNIDNIKSLEGADICWVEEAQNVSKGSWNKLAPTIRKEGSEIWVTFNPELEADETYQRFVVRPPTNSIVVRITWRDNPFFTSVLQQEMEDLKARDPDAYENVWEGKCKKAVEGAIFAAQLSAAEGADPPRLTSVPYNPAKSVSTFWDLGWSDCVAIWFMQKIGFEWRAIDYLEDSQKTLEWYIRELQKKPYVYDTDWLPHDGRHKTLAAGGKSLEQQARELSRKVNIIPVLPLDNQINTARTVFPNVYFDRERCADGLHALRHYQYKVLEDGSFSKEPLHNWASHGASAFMGFAVSTQNNPKKPKKPQDDVNYRTNNATGWMGA
jgi:phage terminase large subunit